MYARGVNCRKEPTSGAELSAKLDFEDVVVELERKDDWVRHERGWTVVKVGTTVTMAQVVRLCLPLRVHCASAVRHVPVVVGRRSPLSQPPLPSRSRLRSRLKPSPRSRSRRPPPPLLPLLPLRPSPRLRRSARASLRPPLLLPLLPLRRPPRPFAYVLQLRPRSVRRIEAHSSLCHSGALRTPRASTCVRSRFRRPRCRACCRSA